MVPGPKGGQVTTYRSPTIRVTLSLYSDSPIKMNNMKNNNLLALALVALVVGGAAFFGGMKYQESKQLANMAQVRGQLGARGGMGSGARIGSRGVTGEIIASDDKTVTVKLADGSSKIVILASNVTINKATQGSKDDLKMGIRVSVFGTENADGSVTAQNIQLNPMLRPEPSVNINPVKK